MTRKGSADVGFLVVDGYSILGTVTELDDEVRRLLEDNTVLGDGDEVWEPVGAMRSGSISQKGFFDEATDSVHDLLVRLASTGVLMYAPEGNTLGLPFVGFAGALTARYRRIASKGALHKAEADYKVSGAVDNGDILHILQAETASPFTGATDDNAASTPDGAAGYLEVTALTLGGYTSATVKLRDSTDDIAYADLITFPNVTAAPSAAPRQTVTGTVNRYTQTEVTWNGAGAAQSITFATGLARGGVLGNRAIT